MALELLGKALAIDPNYAEAHGLAAWCHIQRVWTDLRPEAQIFQTPSRMRAL